MKLEYRKLSDFEVTEYLREYEGWSLENGQMTKTFSFENYLDGPAFAVKVGRIAEDLNHHPDILITWCKVKVSVNTHDVQGISPYDFELARLVDLI